MTTIACDGKTMAGDSLINASGELVGYIPKVYRASDGRPFGCCGLTTDMIIFRDWMQVGGANPKLSEDFEALILNHDGSIEYMNEKLEPVPYMAPMTLGSGGGIALGAMLAGKSPAEAVEIAARRDTKTGGTITVLELHPKAKLEAA